MEKKQTAIDWLVKTINNKIDYIPIKYWDSIRDIVQQAKAMEKQQIIEAHGIKENHGWKDGISFWKATTGEQYYNITYQK